MTQQSGSVQAGIASLTLASIALAAIYERARAEIDAVVAAGAEAAGYTGDGVYQFTSDDLQSLRCVTRPRAPRSRAAGGEWCQN